MKKNHRYIEKFILFTNLHFISSSCTMNNNNLLEDSPPSYEELFPSSSSYSVPYLRNIDNHSYLTYNGSVYTHSTTNSRADLLSIASEDSIVKKKLKQFKKVFYRIIDTIFG